MRSFVINLDSRPDRMKEFRKNSFPFYFERVSATPMAEGWRGCAKSHLQILMGQFIHDREFPFIIFEDDCKMIQPWSLVEEAMSQLPSNWDALWLGGTLDAPLKRYSENLFIARKIYCTQAIIYNSKSIVNFILENYRLSSHLPIDVFYYREVLPKFNCFLTYPMTTIQYGGVSDIMGREQDESDQVWRKKCYDKFTRV